MKKNEKIVEYNNNDIKTFESLYKSKALKKDKKPSKLFLKWLIKDDSHIVKKTVVKLENNDLYDNKKVNNISYEVSINKTEFDKTISNLIAESEKFRNNDSKKQEIQQKIKDLLYENLDNDNLQMNTNINALDVSAQDNLLNTSENYLAYVYFFWSPETMNFKIIGLHSINPLFEFVNVKQTFYLIKPAMITNDTPIYFCFDKIPYSVSFVIKDDLIKLTDYFIENGTTSDIFYYMEKNKTFIRVYGFNKIPLRIWIEFLLAMGFLLMLEYIVLFNIYFSQTKG